MRFLKPGPRYSWKRTLLTIGLSLLPLLLAALLLMRYQSHMRSHGPIIGIVQTAQDPLETLFLAETLGLSVDQPTTLVQFDLQEGVNRLLATHLIKSAVVKKIQPNLLLIDHTLRTPIAYLKDYSNTAIDEEGVLFPPLPHYLPRRVPEIYLGQLAPSDPWGKQLSQEYLYWIKEFSKCPGICRIDLSQIEESSLGKQQIVLLFDNGDLVRLMPNKQAQQLAHYYKIREKIVKEAAIIDLRLPDVAYIRNGTG